MRSESEPQTAYHTDTIHFVRLYLLVYAEPVCTLLTLLLLPPLLKLTGVWPATPTAQVVTFVIAWAAKRRVDAKN